MGIWTELNRWENELQFTYKLALEIKLTQGDTAYTVEQAVVVGTWELVWGFHQGHLSGLKRSWTGEPGRLQSTGLQRVRHNWVTKHIHKH